MKKIIRKIRSALRLSPMRVEITDEIARPLWAIQEELGKLTCEMVRTRHAIEGQDFGGGYQTEQNIERIADALEGRRKTATLPARPEVPPLPTKNAR